MTSTPTGPLYADMDNQKDLLGMTFASVQHTFGLEDTESTSQKQEEVSR